MRVWTLCAMMVWAGGLAGGQALEERLGQPLPPHPRLLVGAEGFEGVRAKIAPDARLKHVWAYVEAGADRALTLEPLERKQVGKRLLGVSRECLQRVSYLAFAYRMTGNTAYLRHAESLMVGVAGFADWNPSHFLDVAEMTAALAIGYDWLYADLAPASRDAIREAIVSKGLDASFPGGGWVLTASNWNQVCHGGLTLGALAVFEEAPERARKTVLRAVASVPRAMAEYEPDGVYPEGPSYWGYGTSYNVLLIAALESALGSDFGLVSGALMKSPYYYAQATGPLGLYYNYSDCSARGGVSPALHWFARLLGDPSLLWQQRGFVDALDPAAAREGKAGLDRLLPCLLLWGGPMADAPAPAALSWHGGGSVPVAILRDGWERDACYLAIKGGSPGANHAHMDIGSFVFDRDGVRWAADLGAQDYNSLESRGIDLWNRTQKSERWSVFRLNNASHNTLVVDGALQRVKGNAPIVGFDGTPGRASAAVDMTPVYEGQLAEAKRTVRLEGRDAVIEDMLRAPERPVTVRWAMTTNAAVSIDPAQPGAAALEQDGKRLTLRVLEPADARLEVLDVSKPPAEHDAENPNTRMIVFNTALPADGAASLRVSLGG